jgi:glyoxylase-like metal-dependent hydrolase (beta-lactamase superfamily II)
MKGIARFWQKNVPIALGLAVLLAQATQARPQVPATPRTRAWIMPAPPPGAIHPRSVAPGFWVIDETPAHGGSISIFAGADGVLLVDTGVESWASSVATAIAGLGAGPVRFVVNTHGHVDEIGGNAFFARRGARLIGRDDTRRSILERKPVGPASDGRTARQGGTFPPEAAPTIIFDHEMGLRFNGQDIRLIAMPAAHTDNDTIVRFAALDVIVVGDVLRAGEYPSINRHDGGTLDGMIAALDRLLALAGPRTLLVTSHGQVVHRDALVAQRMLLRTARDRVAAMIAEGRSVDEVLAAGVTAGLGARAQPGHISAEQFVRDLYAELHTTG